VHGPGLAGEAEGIVMTYPIDAFTAVDADQAQPGTFYFDGQGQWFLAAQRNGSRSPGALRLTRSGGALIGTYVGNASGQAFSVASPYAVQVTVDDYASLATDGQFLGSILVGSPHTIFAAEQEQILFGLDGLERGDDAPTSRRWRYLRWSAWLVDSTGRSVGPSPLFSVDVAANVDA